MDGLGYVETFIRCHRMVSDRRLHTYWLPVARQAQTPTHQQSVGRMGRAAMRSSWSRAALIAPGRRFAAARHPAVQTVTERFSQRRHRSIQSVSQVHRLHPCRAMSLTGLMPPAMALSQSHGVL
jgi:hypothetical protein